MKSLFACCISMIGLHGFAQTVIPSYYLSITFLKTTNIIFPYRIEKADIGSADVIGHKDPILNNVLFLKAGRRGFAPTNLSVYTSDGKLYSFLVQYKETPDTLNLLFPKNDKIAPTVSDSINDSKLDSDAVDILQRPTFLHRRTSEQEMKCILRSIYIRDHLIWLRIEMANTSEVDYQAEYVRFFIKDKHSGKRTAVQETDLSPAWRSPDQPVVGQGKQTLVFAFSVFTIDRHKQLVLQISEKNGGRSLELPINNKTMLKARK
jgi:conjugative transposon TraN protein